MSRQNGCTLFFSFLQIILYKKKERTNWINKMLQPFMGRTKRKRKNKTSNHPLNLDQNPLTINLNKFMSRNKWQNETNLQLRLFKGTGRGVASTKNIHAGNLLIKIPFDIMITYKTLTSSPTSLRLIKTAKQKLKIHECLALFLIIEKHKGKEKSPWSYYIDSLPEKPPSLPWLLPEKLVVKLPPDLYELAEKCIRNFEESWRRCRSIWYCDSCDCTNKESAVCVLDLNIFTWAYVLVNTRAVYVSPKFISELCDSDGDYLSDEPSLALCPFLDMFNHSYRIQTEANLNLEHSQLFYQLKTFNRYKKFEQIFISYGPHNNDKLLMEYGFFIPGNTFDSVQFKIEEILDILELKLNKFQFRFIKDHQLGSASKLYIDDSGLSFNLSALIFVALNREIRNYSCFIYDTCRVTDDLRNKEFRAKLLEFKLRQFETYLDNFIAENYENNEFSVVVDYLKYRVSFVEDLLRKT